MIRKLVMVLLTGVFCLLGVASVLAWETYTTLAGYEEITGKTIEEFSEAPMLKTMVAAGELPPVEERLPEEPMVVEPLEKIGQYGGTIRQPAISPVIEGADVSTIHFQPLFTVDFKTLKSVPNIAKGWDLSENKKSLIVYLRKGMKWSDGVPFTADDFLFWYEDIILNDELTPVKPNDWIVDGELVKVEKVDDYTVRFRFAAPFESVIDMVSRSGYDTFRPKHYLKKYHIKYNLKANELAEKEGYDFWWKCFQFHNDLGNTETRHDVNAPGLGPWVLSTIDASGNKYFERNAYYWKIDTAGNQLPYIDREIGLLVENVEVVAMKSMTGEYDASNVYLAFSDYPLFKKNEGRGNYQTMLWRGGRGVDFRVVLNQTCKDPVLKKILRDIRFRQAMSLAINREEINEILYMGKATPRQATTIPTCSFYEDWMGEYYAEYDPEKANMLLDEMGLQRGKDEYRLSPDGEPLVLDFIFYPIIAYTGKIADMVGTYWNEVGVKTNVKQVARDYFYTLWTANELQVSIDLFENVSEFNLYYDAYQIFYSGIPLWQQWVNTNGEQGEEPPEGYKKLHSLLKQWRATSPETEEYLKLGKELLTQNAKNLYNIGTVGMTPQILLKKNNLHNVPDEEMLTKPTCCWDYRFFMSLQPDQWFFSSE